MTPVRHSPLVASLVSALARALLGIDSNGTRHARAMYRAVRYLGESWT